MGKEETMGVKPHGENFLEAKIEDSFIGWPMLEGE